MMSESLSFGQCPTASREINRYLVESRVRLTRVREPSSGDLVSLEKRRVSQETPYTPALFLSLISPSGTSSFRDGDPDPAISAPYFPSRTSSDGQPYA